MDSSNATLTAAKAAPTPQLVAASKRPVPGKVEQPPAAAADPASASVTTSTDIAESGGEEEEQVEKFYALLANIRAMRAMYARDAGACTDDTASASEVRGGVRKRARWAEQRWWPSFRMEDFEEAPDGSVSKKGRRDDVGVASSRWPGKETTEEAVEDGSDEAGRRGRRVVKPSSSRRKV
ncbi:NRR repressor homolog 1-like [Lolium rigidum]|uniref:NRR repressor homolog 1-like n=1 Tax=Lolium rigidum TaxID=89674 RepID=UPI001F5CFEF1|nr:NRR repressor homolog 1-like [Lolium rigidum]